MNYCIFQYKERLEARSLLKKKIGHFVIYLSIFSKSLKTDILVDISCSWLADFCWHMLSPFPNHMECILWCIFKGNYYEPWAVSFLELRNFSSGILIFFWSLQ